MTDTRIFKRHTKSAITLSPPQAHIPSGTLFSQSPSPSLTLAPRQSYLPPDHFVTKNTATRYMQGFRAVVPYQKHCLVP